MVKRTCSVDRCPNVHYARGWCVKHYRRWHTKCDPLAPVRVYRGRPGVNSAIEPAERIWNKISRVASGCWEWTGAADARGYGVLTNRGQVHKAHRFVYELLVESIPEGLHIDHLCRNPPCVNPAHLEPVTPLENTRRGEGHGSETACPQGHPYAGTNLREHKGRRYCRQCGIERAAAWRAARKAA